MLLESNKPVGFTVLSNQSATCEGTPKWRLQGRVNYKLLKLKKGSSSRRGRSAVLEELSELEKMVGDLTRYAKKNKAN